MNQEDDSPYSHGQRIAKDWIKTIEGDSARIRDQDIYPRLNAWVNLASPTRVLEIGSGQGICSDKIDLVERSYVGVEPSPILLARAKELYPVSNRQFILGNAYSLPFSPQTFDAAFSVSVWHLLGDLKKAAEELSRVLRDQGHFLIMTANPAAYTVWTSLYHRSKLDGRRFEGTFKLQDQSEATEVLYLHSLDELMSSFSQVDLHVQQISPFRNTERGQGIEMLISFEGQKK